MAARQSGQPTSLGRSPLSLRLWRKTSSLISHRYAGLRSRSASARSRGETEEAGESDDQRRYQHQHSNPASHCAALRHSPRSRTTATAPWGVPASCANRRRACDESQSRCQPSDKLPIAGRHQGTQSDPARLCLADPPPMVCAAVGMASRGIVCVERQRAA